MSGPVTVLYIGGYGRSGSTILGQTLAQLPGFVNVGELLHTWSRGFKENELCGCGEPFRTCEFWRAFGEEAFGGWANGDVSGMLEFYPYFNRLRYTAHYSFPAGFGLYNRKINAVLEECGPVLERLYRAIRQVSGAGVIVDSSKRPSYAILLSMLPSVDLRVVHLIRDSWAVTHSWTRSKERIEIVGSRVFMHRASPAKASRTWSLRNQSYGLLRRLAPFSRLRYEDFVAAPAFHLGETLDGIRMAAELVDSCSALGRKVSLDVAHTVSGIPGRFKTGTVELRPDEDWKVNMRAADRRVVTALTAPLLLKYGYLGGEKA